MNLKLLITTDIHGSIFPTNYTSRDNIQTYGMAHIASAIHKFRAEGPLLVLDNGDSFQGTPLVSYAHQHPDQYANPVAQTFNLLGYDYINLGNHDFNYGPAILEKFMQETKAALLTSNVIHKGHPIGTTQIITYGDKKIALIGVLTQYVPNWERPAYIQDTAFIDALTHLQAEVARVKNQADFVIALYHGGLERDPSSGEPTERLTGENQGYEMTSIDGLDLLITGHQHRSLVENIHGVLVTQSTFKAQEFVTIDLDLETRACTAQLHKASDYPVDETLLQPFQELNEKVQDWLDLPVGQIDDTSPSLRIADEFTARVQKHPLVSFLNQVQLKRANADLSATALFNGATGFHQFITMRELVSTYLYPNTLVVKRISGSVLREFLEFSAHYFAVSDAQLIPSPEYVAPKPQHYNYDMVDGVSYEIHVAKPRGQRIHALTYHGKAVQDDDSFTFVTNNYRAAGGGNFAMLVPCEVVQEIHEEMVDTIADYLQEHQPAHVMHTNNIKVIL